MLVIAPGTYLTYKTTSPGAIETTIDNLVGFSNSGASRAFTDITGVLDTSKAKFPGRVEPGNFSATFLLDDGKRGGTIGGVQYVAFNNLFVRKTPIILTIRFSGDWTGITPYPFTYSVWVSGVSGFSVEKDTGAVTYTVTFEVS